MAMPASGWSGTKGDAQAPALAVDRPAGLQPAPAPVQEKLSRLLQSTARFRGLSAETDVALYIVGQAALATFVEAALHQDLPRGGLQGSEQALKLLGLLPEDLDLEATLEELLTSEIAAYYDHRLDYIGIVEEGFLSPGELDEMGPETAERLEEAVLVHELVHAIQDQHFDLSRFEGELLLSDQSMAWSALVEGDATLAMLSFALDLGLERLPFVEQFLSEPLTAPEGIMNLAPELTEDDALLAAPAFLRESLLFPYVNGLNFCVRVRRAGGQKLLDHAFASDVPASTEQILHPDKWFGKRDVPVRIELPDFSSHLPGSRLQSAGSLGELNTRLVLAERGVPKVEVVAAGWGGDTFALYATDAGAPLLVWLTEWDTPAEAEEFHSAARVAFRDGWRLSAAATRVTLLYADLAEDQLAAVEAALLAAPDQRQPPREMDLAALGIRDSDRPPQLEPQDLLAILANPIVQAALELAPEAEHPTIATSPAVADGARPLRIGGAVQAPRKLHAPPPQYTEEARQAGIEGTVTLRGVIDRQGNVAGAEVVSGLEESLNRVALETFRTWIFEPATLDGRAVAVHYNISVNFRLEKEQVPHVEPAPAGNAEADPAPPSGTAPFTIGDDVVPPVKLFSPQPDYVKSARKKRIQGVVILQAIIDKKGDVTNIRVLKGLPEGLSLAAAEAVKRWKFRPATLNGKPVAVYYNVTVNFRLEGRPK